MAAAGRSWFIAVWLAFVISQYACQTDREISQLKGVPHKEKSVELHVLQPFPGPGPQTPCRCWNVTDELIIECECRGMNVKQIPDDLDINVNRITLSDSALRRLNFGMLQYYNATLQDFVVGKANHLESIAEDAFQQLPYIQRIYIHHAPLLKVLPVNLFRVYLPRLKILHIARSGLIEFPFLGDLTTDSIMHTVDLESNHITTITSNSVRLRTAQFSVDYNALQSVDAAAFNGSQIGRLSFKGNRLLRLFHLDAFSGLASLRTLDLSETSITELPMRGVSELEVLRLQDTETLKVFPSVYNFQSLREAWLTYPYHCCAFQFPAAHDPEKHARHGRYLAEMQRKYCTESSTPTEDGLWSNGALSRTEHHRVKRYRAAGLVPWDVPVNSSHPEDHSSTFHIDHDAGFDNGFGSSLDGEIDFEISDLTTSWTEGDFGIFHQHSVSLSPERVHAYLCGNISKTYTDVKCSPQPDAFNPCEDIMGTSWLRIAAWMVAIASVVGNLAVILVLLSSRFRMTVAKLLMVNLASADLCMGVYLLLIAAMDIHTIGVYFNHAIDWQKGIGCKVAGFLTVFASELSIFTLVVITCERWYTITYAIHLNRRLRMSTTAKIMALGWTYSLIMASLPLIGVSGFSTTSICLPLDNRDIGDTIYLTVLLVTKGVAFVIICICYGHMYHSISGHNESLASHSDATVAKRMALLVFTDFSCWAPIAFFGITAVSGYPLIDVTHSKILLVFFYPLNACTNPYLYAMLTKQYRRDLFLLLSRYGFCTQRAARYKAVFSAAWRNPRPPGSQSPSVFIRRSSGLTMGTTLDNVIKKRFSLGEGHRNLTSSSRPVGPAAGTTPSGSAAAPGTSIELAAAAAAPRNSVSQTRHGSLQIERFSNRRLSMVREVSHSDDFGTLAQMAASKEGSSPRECAGSPHPLKNCHIRLNSASN